MSSNPSNPSNDVECCRILSNFVELFRMLLSNFVELGRIFRIMSNDVEFLSNVVEFSRILSNSPRILSNASNPLNFIDFYLFFPEFWQILHFGPIQSNSRYFQFISVHFSPIQLLPSHFYSFQHIYGRAT